MSPVLGIDLGTTNSAVAVARGGEVQVLSGESGALIPSVVSFHAAGDVMVGHAARERRLLDAKNTIYSIKRLIGRPFGSPEVRRAQERFPFEICEGPGQSVLVRARGETYTLPEISAFVLREVRRIAEASLGEPCTRAVITVPANFNELQRSATKAAGRVAGLDVLRILNEPTAAALAYGYGKGSRERIAIFDLGGGTFDLTILELAGDVFEVLATAGDTFLGGDDFDVLIADRMADAFLHHHRFDPRRDPQAYERVRAAAEWAKCQLSGEADVQLRVEELAYGEGGASLDLSFGFTRIALETLIRPLVGRAFDVCEDAMRVAGIRPTQLDNVVLVGGSTRIPLVREMVREYFGREPLGHIDPDLVVARGAALQAAALAPEQAKPLARVALKKVSMVDLPAQARREELASEARQQRPQQPAFAPPALPLWDDVDEQPTSAGARPLAQGDEDPLEPVTRAASAFELEQAARKSTPPALWDAIPTSAGAPALAPEPVVRQGQVAIGAPAARAQPPPVPAAPPPSRRRADVAPGASTLGFGSGGLPVPEGLSTPPALPPAPPSAFVLPSVPPPAQAPPPPLLLDVTPLSLGIETVGGYCEAVISRNAAIPVEQARVFTTAQDDQETVLVRIAQGESRRMSENQALGEIQLSGLRRAARGDVQIEVTFMLDADGTLGVKAKDLETGRVESVRVNLLGGLGEDEVRRMAERQARMAR